MVEMAYSKNDFQQKWDIVKMTYTNDVKQNATRKNENSKIKFYQSPAKKTSFQAELKSAIVVQ